MGATEHDRNLWTPTSGVDLVGGPPYLRFRWGTYDRTSLPCEEVSRTRYSSKVELFLHWCTSNLCLKQSFDNQQQLEVLVTYFHLQDPDLDTSGLSTSFLYRIEVFWYGRKLGSGARYPWVTIRSSDDQTLKISLLAAFFSKGGQL